MAACGMYTTGATFEAYLVSPHRTLLSPMDNGVANDAVIGALLAAGVDVRVPPRRLCSATWGVWGRQCGGCGAPTAGGGGGCQRQRSQAWQLPEASGRRAEEPQHGCA